MIQDRGSSIYAMYLKWFNNGDTISLYRVPGKGDLVPFYGTNFVGAGKLAFRIKLKQPAVSKDGRGSKKPKIFYKMFGYL